MLVSNAATGVIRPALEVAERHWDWTLNANARAFLTLARHAAARMEPGSSIVAISSLGSTRVLEKAGYVREGVLKSGAVKHGRVYDQLLYARVNPSWRGVE